MYFRIYYELRVWLKKCSFLSEEGRRTGKVLRPMIFQRLPPSFFSRRSLWTSPSAFRDAVEILSLIRKTIKQLSGICSPSSAEITSALRAMTRANQIILFMKTTSIVKKQFLFPVQCLCFFLHPFRTKIVVMSFKAFIVLYSKKLLYLVHWQKCFICDLQKAFLFFN